MRKFYLFLIGLIMLCSLSSCETYTYATTQDDIYIETDVDIVSSNIDFDIVIKFGTPYYHNGVLLYYLYDNLYYYPYWYNNYWYVRAYRRPFTHFDTRPYFRPHRYDYKFRPGVYRGYDRPRPNINHHSNFRHNRRPDIEPRRPIPNRQSNINQRPNQPNNRITPQPRTNTRQITPRTTPQNAPRIDRNQNIRRSGGNFGGSRQNRK